MRTRSLLRELSERFDLVIFDTAPTLALADAAILSALADGVVLVVRAGLTDRAGYVRDLDYMIRYAPAYSEDRLVKLLVAVEQLFEKYTVRISTPELNRFLAELQQVRQPPARDGRRLNVLYGTQTSVRPPRFRLFVNDPGLVTRDYGYWVENRLRDHFELSGVPVIIDFVRRS